MKIRSGKNFLHDFFVHDVEVVRARQHEDGAFCGALGLFRRGVGDGVRIDDEDVSRVERCIVEVLFIPDETHVGKALGCLALPGLRAADDEDGERGQRVGGSCLARTIRRHAISCILAAFAIRTFLPRPPLAALPEPQFLAQRIDLGAELDGLLDGLISGSNGFIN